MQLLAVQQVAALRSFPTAAYDKTRTSFTANYLPLDARLTATRVAPEEAPCRSLAPLSHQHVEFDATLVDRTPQQVLGAASQTSRPDAMCCPVCAAPLWHTGRIRRQTCRTSNGSFHT
jgi:hypothetical protein